MTSQSNFPHNFIIQHNYCIRAVLISSMSAGASVSPALGWTVISSGMLER